MEFYVTVILITHNLDRNLIVQVRLVLIAVNIIPDEVCADEKGNITCDPDADAGEYDTCQGAGQAVPWRHLVGSTLTHVTLLSPSTHPSCSPVLSPISSSCLPVKYQNLQVIINVCFTTMQYC